MLCIEPGTGLYVAGCYSSADQLWKMSDSTSRKWIGLTCTISNLPLIRLADGNRIELNLRPGFVNFSNVGRQQELEAIQLVTDLPDYAYKRLPGIATALIWRFGMARDVVST